MPQFLFDIEQGSDEWYFARMGKATASNFSRIVTEAKGEWSAQAPKYAREVAVQRLLDEETEARIGHLPAIERGKLMEPDAAEAYTRKTGLKTTKIGLVVSDCGTRACSPDLLWGDPNAPDKGLGGVEMKCPRADTHLEYLENGGPGRSYIWQVLGSMLVAGFDSWDFWSYHPGLDGVLVRYLRRDHEKEIGLLDAALSRFESEVQRYVEIMRANGYEPPIGRMTPRAAEEWREMEETDPTMWEIG